MTKNNLNIPYFSLRLLTIFCYFLPFIFFLSTCTIGTESKEAFNKRDAIAIEKEMTSYKIAGFNKLIDNIDTNSKSKTDAIKKLRHRIKANCSISENEANLYQDLPLIILMPTSYSLSGIGAVYHHKNIIARIVLGISMLISILTLLLWRILKRRKIRLFFISLNIGAVLFFILLSLIANVSLLYGIWTLLSLLIIQLLTELQTSKSINTADT